MKGCILLTAILIFTISGFAGIVIQKGQVREQNSRKKGIPGVQIIFKDAKATDSDDAGYFRLVFQDKKPGQLIFKEQIYKDGYELVNEKDFDIVKISDTDSLGVDIIMAKAGTVDAAKKEYYNVSDRALLQGFNREKQALKQLLEKAQLSQQEYEEKYEALRLQYEDRKKELDRLAEMFARVNFDDVSALYREALELFKRGRIDEAIKILESANLVQRIDKRLAERKRLQGAAEEIARQNADNEKGIKEDIQSLQLQAKMYGLKFEISKAEALYDKLLECDSTRLDILMDSADFYRENHRYQKAFDIYPKIIAHPQAEEWQKANAYGHLGELYTTVGQLEQALGSYTLLQNQYANLAKENPSSSFYKGNLAVSYSKLGETHTSLGRLDRALEYYEKDWQLTKELYDAYPNNVNFKNGLAISYQNMGNTHTALGRLDRALEYYEELNRLEKELYDAYPNNVNFKNGLAISYLYLGLTYEINENKPKAKEFYLLAKELLTQLVHDFPRYVKFKTNLDWVEKKLTE